MLNIHRVPKKVPYFKNHAVHIQITIELGSTSNTLSTGYTKVVYNFFVPSHAISGTFGNIMVIYGYNRYLYHTTEKTNSRNTRNTIYIGAS